MRLLLILFFSFAFQLASGQGQELVTEGMASMRVKPDVLIMNIEIEKTDTLEWRALRKLNETMSKVNKVLEGLGVDKAAVRIANYRVNSDYNEDAKRKEYTVTNSLFIEVMAGSEFVNALLSAIEKQRLTDLNFEFDTRLSDSLEKTSRKALIQMAIKNGQEVAESMAAGLNMKLGAAKQISNASGYQESNRTIEIVKATPSRIVADRDFSYETSFANFQVKELEVREQVVMTFYLQAK